VVLNGSVYPSQSIPLSFTKALPSSVWYAGTKAQAWVSCKPAALPAAAAKVCHAQHSSDAHLERRQAWHMQQHWQDSHT
jgi:hypothetical protein